MDCFNVMSPPKITKKLLWLVLSDEICLISSHNSTGGAVCVLMGKSNKPFTARMNDGVS